MDQSRRLQKYVEAHKVNIGRNIGIYKDQLKKFESLYNLKVPKVDKDSQIQPKTQMNNRPCTEVVPLLQAMHELECFDAV